MPKSSEKPSGSIDRYERRGVSQESVRGVKALAETPPVMCHQCVVAILTAGDAVLFGTTRDGGAIAVQVMAGTEVAKFYASSQDEVQELLQELAIAALDH